MGVHRHQEWKPLGKGLPWACGVHAEKAADRQTQPGVHRTDGKIARLAVIAAMDAIRRMLTRRTHGGRRIGMRRHMEQGIVYAQRINRTCG